MKNLIFFFFLILPFVACKKKHERPQGSAELESFECKLNGVDFVPTNIPFQCEALTFHYYPEDYMNTHAGYLVMGSKNCVDLITLRIRIAGLKPGFTGSINMIESTKIDSCFPYYRYFILESDTSILSEKLLAGSITFNEFTPRADGNSEYGSISGTFWFDLSDSFTGDTLRFTDGRFRFDVPQIF